MFIDRPGRPWTTTLPRGLRGPVIGAQAVVRIRQSGRSPVFRHDVRRLRDPALNRIDVGRWLTAWLTACAQNGGRPPDDLGPWLPWSMDEKRRQGLRKSTMRDEVECRYHGRDFTTAEMALMRSLIAASPQQTRAGLAREFCHAINWVGPDDRIRAMMARLTMLAMHRDGIITLPPPPTSAETATQAGALPGN